MKAEEFDERFDAGEGMAAVLDETRARRPGEEPARVDADSPGARRALRRGPRTFGQRPDLVIGAHFDQPLPVSEQAAWDGAAGS